MKKVLTFLAALFCGLVLVSCGTDQQTAELQKKIENKSKEEVVAETANGVATNYSSKQDTIKGIKAKLTATFENDNFVVTVPEDTEGVSKTLVDAFKKFKGFTLEAIYTKEKTVFVTVTVPLGEKNIVAQIETDATNLYFKVTGVPNPTNPNETNFSGKVNLQTLKSALSGIAKMIPSLIGSLTGMGGESEEVTPTPQAQLLAASATTGLTPEVIEQIKKYVKDYSDYISFEVKDGLLNLNLNVTPAQIAAEVKKLAPAEYLSQTNVALIMDVLEHATGSLSLTLSVDNSYNVRKAGFNLDVKAYELSTGENGISVNKNTTKNTKLGVNLEVEEGEFTFTSIEGKAEFTDYSSFLSFLAPQGE